VTTVEPPSDAYKRARGAIKGTLPAEEAIRRARDDEPPSISELLDQVALILYDHDSSLHHPDECRPAAEALHHAGLLRETAGG
jgi:hypothetical protein